MGRLKRVLEQSGWYYVLIKRMITEEIHKKPLAQFMSGKFILAQTAADQIKNVIEAGQVYSAPHFKALVDSMLPGDLE